MGLGLARQYFAPGKLLAEFDDDIITRPAGMTGAVLDTGFFGRASDPDFGPAGNRATREESITGCADRIRENAGSDKPAMCLCGYDLTYRLMPHWDRKERLRDLGIDPNALIQDMLGAQDLPDWGVRSQGLGDAVKAKRHMEFFFRLVTASQTARIENLEVTPDQAVREAMAEVTAEYQDLLDRGMSDQLKASIEERLCRDLAPAPEDAAPEP